MYLVEHGQEPYDFDSYGLHLGQEDHLSFLGQKDQKLRLKIVDLRENSPTLFKEEEIIFNPAPDMELTIPCGVAHAFFNMMGIITINRPVIFLNPEEKYIPGNDVIDWPIENKDFISFNHNKVKAGVEFYEELILKQQETLESTPSYNTPKSIVFFDKETGKQVKILLKKKV